MFCLKKDEYYVLGTKYSILEGSDCNLIVHYTNLTLGGQKGNRDQLKKTVSSVIDEIADSTKKLFLIYSINLCRPVKPTDIKHLLNQT